MIFNNENPQEINTDLSFGGAPVFPNGWYRLELASETEEKLTQKGDKMGQNFTFRVTEGEHTGNTLTTWLCSRCKNSADSWMEDRTRAFFARIAQVCNIPRLTSTQQIQGHPFYARLVQEEYNRQIVDRETEEVRTEKSKRMAFAPGKFTEIVLSASEYAEKFRPAEAAPKKFVKAQRPAPPAEALPDAEHTNEVPW